MHILLARVSDLLRWLRVRWGIPWFTRLERKIDRYLAD
jgi:hypothetical protein